MSHDTRRVGSVSAGRSIVLALAWVATLATDAEAYIDPSAGGMLLQLLLAGTAGVAVLARLFWTRIRRMIGLPERQDAADEEVVGHDIRSK